MDRAIALESLKAMVAAGTVPAQDKEFVGSLVSQSDTRGLSENQWYWVAKLAAKLTGAPAPAVTVGAFERVYAMFQKAKQHLQHPKVVLQAPSGREVKLYVSGARSRVPDTVNVVDQNQDLWFGRVYQDGRWEQGKADTGMAEVEGLLKAFADDPEGVAASCATLTGNCCFCNRKLTDERSTAVGFGPSCAKHYGLDMKWKQARSVLRGG